MARPLNELLTAVAFSVHEMPADKIFDPERFADASSGRLLALAVAGTGVLALQGVHLQNLQIQNVLAGFQLGLQGGDDVDTGNNHLGPVGQAFFHQKV